MVPRKDWYGEVISAGYIRNWDGITFKMGNDRRKPSFL